MKNSLEIIIKQVRFDGGFQKKRQNQSGGVFEADYCKQMGQHKKPIFRQMFLCLHER